ncbi:MAG TPA: hypothetical protein PKI93_07270 [Alphaproteobacteria bacterium]|nr:hypothetical protein [Alphaproteobacteria bacterium]HNS43876.1 hypothetical protein [Alphaproteobacteria bacterium]
MYRGDRTSLGELLRQAQTPACDLIFDVADDLQSFSENLALTAIDLRMEGKWVGHHLAYVVDLYGRTEDKHYLSMMLMPLDGNKAQIIAVTEKSEGDIKRVHEEYEYSLAHNPSAKFISDVSSIILGSLPSNLSVEVSSEFEVGKPSPKSQLYDYILDKYSMGRESDDGGKARQETVEEYRQRVFASLTAHFYTHTKARDKEAAPKVVAEERRVYRQHRGALDEVIQAYAGSAEPLFR